MIPAKPLPKDDDDIEAWKTQKFEELKTEFKGSVAKLNEQDLKSVRSSSLNSGRFILTHQSLEILSKVYQSRGQVQKRERLVATGGSTVAKDTTPFYLLPESLLASSLVSTGLRTSIRNLANVVRLR